MPLKRRHILRLTFHSSLPLDDVVSLPKVMMLFGLTFPDVMYVRFVEGPLFVFAISFVILCDFPDYRFAFFNDVTRF
jgi:hypothetical protein